MFSWLLNWFSFCKRDTTDESSEKDMGNILAGKILTAQYFRIFFLFYKNNQSSLTQPISLYSFLFTLYTVETIKDHPLPDDDGEYGNEFRRPSTSGDAGEMKEGFEDEEEEKVSSKEQVGKVKSFSFPYSLLTSTKKEGPKEILSKLIDDEVFSLDIDKNLSTEDAEQVILNAAMDPRYVSTSFLFNIHLFQFTSNFLTHYLFTSTLSCKTNKVPCWVFNLPEVPCRG